MFVKADLTGLTRTPTVSTLIIMIQVTMSESFLFIQFYFIQKSLFINLFFIHMLTYTFYTYNVEKKLSIVQKFNFILTNQSQTRCWQDDGHWRTRLHDRWRQVSWWCNWYTWWLSPHTCLILLHSGEFHSPFPWRLTSGRRQYLMIRMTTAFWRSRSRPPRTLPR